MAIPSHAGSYRLVHFASENPAFFASFVPPRITSYRPVRYHMAALSREELTGYLAHRLRLASAEVPLFDPSAEEAIYQATDRETGTLFAQIRTRPCARRPRNRHYVTGLIPALWAK